MSKIQSFIHLEVCIDRELRDRCSEVLWELGTLGFEETSLGDAQLKIAAYFPQDQPADDLRAAFLSALGSTGCQTLSCSVESMECDPNDWVVEYSKSFQAFNIGRDYFIYPSWSSPNPDYPINLQLDPGHGFGTGTHESTQLVLLTLPKVLQNAESLLDVGTGSGILTIAARKLAPGLQVTACDVDGLALESAEENLRQNSIAGVQLLPGGPEVISGQFDVVLANLTCNILRRIDTDLVRLTARDLIVSGFTEDQVELVVECFCKQHPFRVEQQVESNGWVCLHLQQWPLS